MHQSPAVCKEDIHAPSQDLRQHTREAGSRV